MSPSDVKRYWLQWAASGISRSLHPRTRGLDRSRRRVAEREVVYKKKKISQRGSRLELREKLAHNGLKPRGLSMGLLSFVRIQVSSQGLSFNSSPGDRRGFHSSSFPPGFFHIIIHSHAEGFQACALPYCLG